MRTLLLIILGLLALLLNASLFFVMVYLIGLLFSWLISALLIPFALSGFRKKDGLIIFISVAYFFSAACISLFYSSIYISTFCTRYPFAAEEILNQLQSTKLIWEGPLPSGIETSEVQLTDSKALKLSSLAIKLLETEGEVLLWKPVSFERLIEIRMSEDLRKFFLLVQNSRDEQVIVVATAADKKTFYTACGPHRTINK